MKHQPAPWQRILPFIALLPAAAAFRLGNAGSLGSLAIVILTLAFVKSSRKPTFALVRRSWWFDAAIGIALGLMLAIVSDHLVDPLVKQFIGPIKLDDFANVRGNLPNVMILLVTGFIYGGIFEETIFRGFTIGWGSWLLGDKAAWPLAILSSVVFGLAHAYQGLGGIVSAGLIGLAFAAIYIVNDRRLLVPMVVHMTFDAIGIVELYLGLNP